MSSIINEQKNKMNKKLSLIVLTGVALLGCINAYFVWSNKSYSPDKPTCVQSNQTPDVYFNEWRGEFVFACNREINLKENQCAKEIFKLKTGEKISSQEQACYVY